MATAQLGRAPTVLLALLVPVVALVTVVITLDVTDDATSTTAAGGGSANGAAAITIENFQFSPNPIVVKAGDAIAVTNHDGTAHTLTADDGRFDTGSLDGGAEKSVTIASPGTYTYHCEIHNYMRGKVEAR
jgi:plastocyanin